MMLHPCVITDQAAQTAPTARTGAQRLTRRRDQPKPHARQRLTRSRGKLGVDTVSGNYFNHKSDGGNQRYVAATVVSEK